MRLNQNIYSLTVYQNYKQSVSSGNTAMERISSGLQINSAKDNPIKLAKSENLKMQIRSLEMVEKNLQNGQSMIETADTSMATISETLIRIKELSVQAASDSYTDEDKSVIQNEINELLNQVNEVAEAADFNGNKVLTGNGTDDITYKTMQVGFNVGDTLEIPYFNINCTTLGIEGIDVSTSENATEALSKVEDAIKNINSYRSKYGALQNRLESTATQVSDGVLNLEGVVSVITDADIAEETINLSTSDVLIQSATAIMAQTNQFPKDVLNILSNMLK